MPTLGLPAGRLVEPSADQRWQYTAAVAIAGGGAGREVARYTGKPSPGTANRIGYRAGVSVQDPSMLAPAGDDELLIRSWPVDNHLYDLQAHRLPYAPGEAAGAALGPVPSATG
jgi:hypothetical protein